MDADLELQETEVQSPAPLEQQQPKSPAGRNQWKCGFTSKYESHPNSLPRNDFNKNCTAATAKVKKRRGRKPKSSAVVVASEEEEAEGGVNKKSGEKTSATVKESSTVPTPAATAWRQPPSSSSFQQYRRAGDMGETESKKGASFIALGNRHEFLYTVLWATPCARFSFVSIEVSVCVCQNLDDNETKPRTQRCP